MLNLAILAANSLAGDAIEQMTSETGIFKVVLRTSPTALPVPTLLRTLMVHDPDLILLEIGDWESVVSLASQINGCNLRGITVGFRPSWNGLERVAFENAGIRYLLHEPFSPGEIETAAYEALHKERGVSNRNILAFLPAKAGGGCSTVAIHTAAALANGLSKNVLLVECDRRSGIYSIMLNLDNQQGLDDALQSSNAMTLGEWHQHIVRVSGLHLLAANPKHRSRLASWAEYYQLLQFVQKQYDYLLVDLPEAVNEATAEVVRSARIVFVVCTPEIASLKMARFRAEELEACEIPTDRIRILVNRLEYDSPDAQRLEEMLERPVFETLPNDYSHLKAAIMESRLASPNSPFAESCRAFARKLDGLPHAAPERFKLALLRKLGRIAG
jgi:MinD-like ATPase involved in chromosome partitioning or flagellar assembly